MSLISRTIAGLYNGVSQQPPTIRFDTQAEDVQDCLPSVARGLERRPPFELVTPINGSNNTAVATSTDFIHFFEFDETKKIAVRIGTSGSNKALGSAVDVLTGIPETNLQLTSFAYWGATIANTVPGTYPRDYLTATTAGDYAVVVDKRQIVAMKAAVTDPNIPTGFIHVKSGVVSNTFTVILNGTTCSFTSGSGAGDGSTITIADGLKTAINTLTGTHGCSATLNTNVIRIVRNDNTDFSMTVFDSYGNTCLVGIKGQITRYADLPPVFYEGYRIKVASDASSSRGAYYVEWKSSGASITGSWVETTPYGIPNEFDKATMPKIFYKNGSGNWDLVDWDWEKRLVGDNTSCPLPSFVGKTISGVFFHRGRLGFISEDNVIMSRSGDNFNFWPKSATAVLDSDPIDIPGSSKDIQKFLYAIPYQKALILFSAKGQYVLSGGDLLSPKSCKIDPSTQYSVSPSCNPVLAGNSIYFVTKKDNFSSVWEYFLQPDGLTYGAEEVTAHLPRYLPNDIDRILACPTESVVVALSKGTRNKIWVYKYQWSADQKIQSAWFTWNVPSPIEINASYFIDSTLYCQSRFNNQTYVLKMNLPKVADEGSSLPYTLYMDYKFQQTGTLVTYNSKTHTRFDYQTYNPFQVASNFQSTYPNVANLLTLALGTEWGNKRGQNLKWFFGNNAAYILVEGDWASHPVWLGLRFNSTFTFSEQFVKGQDDKALDAGRLQLRRMSVRYTESGYFKATVKIDGRDDNVNTWTNRTIGALILGYPSLESGEFSFPVLSHSKKCSITLSNDSTMPSTFHSATWTGDFIVKAQPR